MRNIIILIIITLALTSHIKSQTPDTIFVVYFTTKQGTPYNIEHPSQYLTKRAIDRRQRHSISIDSLDLPVNRQFIDSLIDNSIAQKILYTSRWLNCAVIVPTKEYKYPTKHKWIKSILIITSNTQKENNNNHHNAISTADLTKSHLSQTGITQLHNMQLTGKGVRIAIFDAGFKGVNSLPIFDSINIRQQIKATRDFVDIGSNVYSHHSHGTAVTALLAGILPQRYCGSAPDAEYILVRTENTNYESRIEEFNWLAAAEYADSLGADIINSSLGYTTFDNPIYNYTFDDLTGNVAICSRAAGIAAKKGMIVISSAGNSGNTTWPYVNFPSDNPDIFTIGAIDTTGRHWQESSIGTPQHSYKPDFVTPGTGIWLPSIYSQNFYQSSGTSLSAPIFAGGIACLIQYYKTKTADQIKQALKETADNNQNPNNIIGYGVPDFYKAYYQLQNLQPPTNRTIILKHLYYNNNSQTIELEAISTKSHNIKIDIFDTNGQILYSSEIGLILNIPISLSLPISNNVQHVVIVSIRGNKGDTATNKLLVY